MTDLKTWRTKEGLTQEELGNKVDSTFVSISRYESGSRRTIRAKVVDALFELSLGEVDANALYGITPERIAAMKKKRRQHGKKKA